MKLIIKLILFVFIIPKLGLAESSSGNKWSFYTGMFDFSDDGKRSVLYGIEHQNENLYRDTIFGRISPVTGAMITQDAATYIYTGVETNYSFGKLNKIGRAHV